MRKLTRPKVQLPTLASGKGAEVRKAHSQERSLNPTAKLDFPAYWGEEDVRGALLAMHGWVCAYCECALGRGNRGHVDHFRPKNPARNGDHQGYWWLAYEFTNYLLGCLTCNSERKGDKFPVRTGASHVTYESREQLEGEPRLLIDPAVDPVESWLRAVLQGRGCMFDIIATDSETQLRAQGTLDTFALNTDRELVQARTRTFHRAVKAHRNGQVEELRRMASRFQPHGAAVRAYITQYARNEVTLPSADEELGWLLEDVDARLRHDQALRSEGRLPPSERPIEEMLWMLAVLWKAPPAWSAEALERWLTDKGWRPQVEPLYHQLCELER